MTPAPLTAALVAVVGAGVALVAAPGPAAASDTTGPVIDVQIRSSPGTGAWVGWYSEPTTFRIAASDTAGIGRTSYRLTGAQSGEDSVLGSTIDGRIDAEGVTTITATATDAFGNVTTRPYGVGIDLTDPTTAVDGVPTTRILEGDERRTTYSCGDPGGAVLTCAATLDGTPFASGALLDTSPGRHTLSVTAQDRVGRRTITSHAYHVDSRHTVSAPPTVTGTARSGATLTVRDGSVTPATSLVQTYWSVDGVHAGQGSRLTLAREHVGGMVRCEQSFIEDGIVRAKAPCLFAGGTDGVRVLDAEWKVVEAPRIAGKATAGRTLRVVVPRLSAAATTHRYQWLRNGRPVARATGAAYKIRKADRGTRLTVRVTSAAPGQPALVTVSAPRRVRR